MMLKWLVGVTSGEGFLVYSLVFVAQRLACAASTASGQESFIFWILLNSEHGKPFFRDYPGEPVPER